MMVYDQGEYLGCPKAVSANRWKEVWRLHSDFAPAATSAKHQADSSTVAFLPFDYYHGSNLVYSSLSLCLYRNVASWCFRIHTPLPLPSPSTLAGVRLLRPRRRHALPLVLPLVIATVTQVWKHRRARKA